MKNLYKNLLSIKDAENLEIMISGNTMKII